MSTISATTAQPCACWNSTGAGTAVTLCAARSGTATLCGFPEWIDSNPVRRFRTKTFSGQMVMHRWDHDDCTGAFTTATVTFSGANMYDNTCALTNAATAMGEIGTGIVQDISTSSLSGITAYVFNVNTFTNVSNIQRTQRFDNGFGSYTCAFGEDPQPDIATIELTDEDTEQNAIARASVAYGPFLPVIADGCCSQIQTRTGSAVSFGFTDCRLQITVTGWGRVKLRVHYDRGPIGGALGYYGYEETVLTLSPDRSTTGSAVYTTSVPNQYGYQTCWAASEVLPADPIH